jgi:hypothetical protein
VNVNGRSAEERECWPARSCASVRLVLGIAERLEIALEALWVARGTNSAAVPDELVREQNPPALWNDLHQVLLDFLRVIVSCEIEPPRKPLHVRIDDNP